MKKNILSKTYRWKALSLFFIFYIISSVAICQKIDQDIDLANSLKKKYGDKVDVVCLQSTITYSFNYSTSKKDAFSPVSAVESIDESLISLKDNYNFENILYHNEYHTVSEIKAYGRNNRSIDISSSDINVGDKNVFYSGEHGIIFSIPFSSLGQKNRYTASVLTNDLKYLQPAFFSDEYPFEEKTIIFNVPKWLNIDFKEENCDGYDITKTVTTDSKTQNTIYTFTAKSIVNYHSDEGHTPDFFSMYPHILILAKQYTTPSGETVNIINSMDDVYKLSEKLIKEAGNNDDDIKPLVARLTEDKKTDTDKIKAIYYWVQDNIRYLAFENGISGLKPAPCQDVYKDKYGDCKGMANLLTIMLKDAGFDARRTWIGVDGIPYDFSTPSLYLFNHVICTLVFNGKNYYLDGVEKYALFGENSDWIQGKQVLIENGNSYVEDKIPIESVNRSKIEVDQDLTVSGSDLLKGNEKAIYNGDSKTDILNEYNSAPTSEKNADIKGIAQGGDRDIEVSSPVTSDLQNREIPVTMDFDFTIKNQVSEFDNDMYVNLDNLKWFQYYTFDSTRYCDYSFRFRKDYVHNINFTIPAGYKVKHVPDNVNIQNPNYSFTITVTRQGNKLVYHKEIVILNPIIKKKDFKTWNADIGQLKKTYDDQLILEKS